MPTRPTTLVEGDQLAQAAMALLKDEESVELDPSLPFSVPSKAQREYDRAVREAIGRRRQAREVVLAERAFQERFEIDAALNDAQLDAEAAQADELAEISAPFKDVETQARAERDAAIAAAERAYQQIVDEAVKTYEREAAVVHDKHSGRIAQANALRDEAYASIDARLQSDRLHLDEELQLVSIEGLLFVTEDRTRWSPTERGKALLALIGLAARPDADLRFTEVCLEHLYSNILQECYGSGEATAGKLMSARLVEALASLAHRCVDKRAMVVKCLHDIVVQHPGVSSPGFIESLTKLYVKVSAQADADHQRGRREADDQRHTILAQISETLKRTTHASVDRQAHPQARGEGSGALRNVHVQPEQPWTLDTAPGDDPFSETTLAEMVDIDELLHSDVQKSERGGASHPEAGEPSGRIDSP